MLVLSPVPLLTGVVVRCRPIGLLKMTDEAGGETAEIDDLAGRMRKVRLPS